MCSTLSAAPNSPKETSSRRHGLAMSREAISSVGNVTTVSNYFAWKIIRGLGSRLVIAHLNKTN